MYAYTQGFYSPVDPNIAAVELLRIKQENGGYIEPQVVVDAARPDDAPLHPALEWHDPTAAEEWRKVQARNLTHSIRIIREDLPERPPERLFVNIQATPTTPRAYYAVEDATKDPVLRAKMIETCWRELQAITARYRELIQAAGEPRLLQVTDIISQREYQEAS